MSELKRDDDDYLMDTREAEALSGLRRATLAKKRCEGSGPRFIKLSPGRGGPVRYWRSDVLAWIEKHAVETSQSS